MEALGTLVTTLVTRNCIHPENVLAIPTQAFVQYIRQHQDGNKPSHARSENGIHFTLFLVKCLFYIEDLVESSESGPLLRFGSERFLLSTTHRGMHSAAILTFLMASILASNHNELMRRNAPPDEKRIPAHQAAAKVMEEICGQDWIKQKFLYDPNIFTEKMLLSNKIGENAPRLLRLITRRKLEHGLVTELQVCEARRDRVEKLLSTLSIWNLRPTLLDLELFLRQSGSNQHETAHALEVIARSTMDLFHNQRGAGTPSPGTGDPLRVGGMDNLFLIAPLMKGLPDNVQGKVLETCAQVLESGQVSRKSSTASTSDTTTKVSKGQEEQRESLVKSLLKQLREYVEKVREDPAELYHPDSAHELHEAILLRLSLVGGMLETVCRGKDVDAWGLVLLQLIFSGILTLNNNKRLFYTCLDMLNVIIHSLFVPDAGLLSDRSPEDTKKIYNALNKKLRKEVGDRYQPSLKLLHQLLPQPKPMLDIVATEPYGTVPTPPAGPASKGALKMGSGNPASPAPASPGGPSSGRPLGLRVWQKERISPWDVVEGLKGREQWNWSWFTTQRLDWAPAPIAASLARLIAHSHYHKPAHPLPPLPGQRVDNYQALQPLTDLQPNPLVASQQAAQQAVPQPAPLPPQPHPPQLPMQQAPGPMQTMSGPGMGGPQMRGPPHVPGMPGPPLGHPHHQAHLHHPQQHQAPLGHPGHPGHAGPSQLGMGILGRQDSGGPGSLVHQNPHMVGLMRAEPAQHIPPPPHAMPGHPGMDYEMPATVRSGRGKRKSGTGGRGGRKKTATPPTPGALQPPPMAYQEQGYWRQGQGPPQQAPMGAGPATSTNSKMALQELLKQRGSTGGPPQQHPQQQHPQQQHPQQQQAPPPQQMDYQQAQAQQQQNYQVQQQQQNVMALQRQQQMQRQMSAGYMQHPQQQPPPQQYYHQPPNQ